MRFSLLFLATVVACAYAENAPSFRHDILPILSKANCNGGGCHGALASKGGFRLSQFGYNPEADWQAITRESLGRRIEPADPGRSLLLTKPAMAIKHKGGKRLGVSDDDNRTIAAWIAAGSPAPSPDDPKLVQLSISPESAELAKDGAQQLTVRAKYSDGTERDVTRWAKFTSANEAVAGVDENGKVTFIGHGQGAVTAWFSSPIVTARITAPYPHKLDEAVFLKRATRELHRRPRLRPAPQTEHQTLARRERRDLRAPRLPRHHRPPPLAGGSARLCRRHQAAKARAARRPAARAARVRGLLGVQVERRDARHKLQTPARCCGRLLQVDSRSRGGKHLVG